MSKRARRIKNTAAVRLFCAAALAALLLAPAAAGDRGAVFGGGADTGAGVVFSAGVVFGDVVTRSDVCVSDDPVPCGAAAPRAASPLAGATAE